MTTPPQHKALFARVTAGPAPYSRGPDENTQCMACHKYNTAEQSFCDQCGAKLPPPAPTMPYVQGPGMEIQCQKCSKYNAGDARYCGFCGVKLAATQFEPPNPESSKAPPPMPAAGPYPVPPVPSAPPA